MKYTEQPILFPCEGETLLGILVQPQTPAGTGVVIVVGGPQYRAGSHRQFVLLSRALAAAGYPVLRFDYRGMGDSTGEPRDFQGVSEDISAAIDSLQKAQPTVRQVVLWGLCDGASAALLYCHETSDPRVSGLCLLNPWVRSEATLARTQVKHYYSRRLMQKEFWVKLLSGQVALVALGAFAKNIRLSTLGSNQPAIETQAFQQRMARGWNSFSGPILLCLSGEDYVAKEFLEHARTDAAWKGSLERASLSRKELQGVDHTFSSAVSRSQVENFTLDWLARQASPTTPLQTRPPSDMEFERFDPTGCGFPKPKVPVLPALSWQSLGLERSDVFSSIRPYTNASYFARGRYALAEAYRLSGVSVDSALLAPAYHCRTMLDPAIRLGAEIGLYALKPDLSPDLETLTACLAASRKPVKAMLLTHYFGFAQSLEPLAAFCAKHDITLIEDCSHALFGKSETNTTHKSESLGKTGRFVIASPYKFFPCEDGGILWANDSAAFPDRQKFTPSLKQELKGLLRSVQRARDQHQPLDINTLDDELEALARQSAPTGRHVRQPRTRISEHYHATEERLTSLTGSRWVIRLTNQVRLAARRRENYLQWAAAVAGLPHCRALFPALPNECVPYMFPLYIDHPEIHFLALKRLGVPVWRWDDMASSTCHVAADYRLRLLHLPCHQELTQDQMAWMTTAVKKAMLQLPAGEP